jgi:hypothetical protein
LRRNSAISGLKSHLFPPDFVERNIAMLRQRGLPVTAGTVYLAHFAGRAGAVAILSAPDNADAAVVIARADSTRRTKRERLIRANPFLEHFTVADLKVWADRKMRGPSSPRATACSILASGIATVMAQAVAAPLTVLPHTLCASADARFSDVLNHSCHVTPFQCKLLGARARNRSSFRILF